MPTPILATKLYIPPPRPRIVHRPHLIERLNDGLPRKLTLISAPAGFGKTTLVSEWVAGCKRPVGWLSLDEEDNDPARFLIYLITALQTIAPNIGKGVLSVLQSIPPPSTESILATLLNEIATIPSNFILVLDDYHLIDSKPIDHALMFLTEHQPPPMYLVIATREDPHLPLARLRACDQLTELRAADLRFTPSEAAEFLDQVIGLRLSAEDIAALEARTEGWIAGLQLAAISMQGYQDATGFIQSFTGTHRFVMDYLIEQVLQQQPESIQTFLLHTSILDRMCGPLCDAVLFDASVAGQTTLEYLERANLFIVPLDNERHWYRYHHLFADLLRQRLGQGCKLDEIAELHIRASQWYENNGLMLEAFRHAVAANDVERAERLMEDRRMPLHIPGTATTILNWLESLPITVLNAHPALWWKQAELLLISGKTMGVEEKLKAAEAALATATLPSTRGDAPTGDLIGKIAVARATLAQMQFETETIFVQARRALEYLHPNDLSWQSTATRTLGFAYYLQGDWAEAARSYAKALSIAQAARDIPNAVLASIRLGQIQELGNQLYLAAETYQHVLQLIGDYSPPNSPVAYLGLARIYYQWNDLDAAEQYGEQSSQLARQYDQVVDRFILSQLFLARLKLAQGDGIGAAHILSQTEQTARQKNFTQRLPDIAAAQILVLLCQGNVCAAAQLAQQSNIPLLQRQYDLPLAQARVLLAQGNPPAALAVLESLREQAEAKGWADILLIVMTAQSVALYAHGEKEKAVELLGQVLALAEPNGFIRLFVDEGEPMKFMISDFQFSILKTFPHLRTYLEKLWAAFPSPQTKSEIRNRKSQILVEPLSERELEVLRLIAQGLSNREISERLFLALSTVKGHSRIIFDKLQVHNRTEAAARARELGLL